MRQDLRSYDFNLLRYGGEWKTEDLPLLLQRAPDRVREAKRHQNWQGLTLRPITFTAGEGVPLSNAEELRSVSQTFSALGNSVRLRILLMLMDSKKPLHITAVASNLKMDYGGVHRHVEILRNAGLLQVFEVGRSRVLSPLNIEQVREFITRAKDFNKKR